MFTHKCCVASLLLQSEQTLLTKHIYLPNTTSKETGKSEFIVFKKYGKTVLNQTRWRNRRSIIQCYVSSRVR